MTPGNVTSEGHAAGLQKSSHTSRGRWTHRATEAAPFILLHRSQAQYDDEGIHSYEWCKQMMASEHSQFDYWYKA